MNNREIEQIRQRVEANYKHKLELAEAEYNQDLMAIERLARLMDVYGNGKGSHVIPATLASISSLSQAVKNVIPDISGEFNINVVIAHIMTKYPGIKTPINPTSVSGILRTLETIGEVELVRRGKGKRPSVYRYNSKKQETEAVDE